MRNPQSMETKRKPLRTEAKWTSRNTRTWRLYQMQHLPRGLHLLSISSHAVAHVLTPANIGGLRCFDRRTCREVDTFCRSHLAQGVISAPESSRVPSSVLSMMEELGSPSSDTVFPARHTQKSSGSSAHRARRSVTCWTKSSAEELGSRSYSRGSAISVMSN